MEPFYSPEVLAGLKKARQKDAMKKNRLRVHTGGDVLPVYRLWEDGFSMLADDAPHIRGFVDIYDGARHLLQCLVIQSETDGDLVHFEFKRSTNVTAEAPRDYAVDENAPVALLGG